MDYPGFVLLVVCELIRIVSVCHTNVIYLFNCRKEIGLAWSICCVFLIWFAVCVGLDFGLNLPNFISTKIVCSTYWRAYG